jgi:uncharacterized membrane protein YecN with MAPEG domain
VIITPLYAGLLTLWFAVLSVRVVQRRQGGITLGDGGDPHMLRLIRGQANFAEYVPLILFLMALLELGHASSYLLHTLGITLVIARLLHGYALSFTQQFRFGRFYGAGLTFLVLVVCAVACLWQGAHGLALSA